MTLTEKAAYLKGLKDGLKLNTETTEGKLLDVIIDLMDDLALTVADLEDFADAASDELDMIEDVIDSLDEDMDDFDYLDDEDDYAFDEALYEIKCPVCNEEIALDEEMLEKGSINCPKCGELLEFDAED